MRLAAQQTAGVPEDPAENLAQLAETVALAAAQGADLLILPELWLTGYNIGDAVHDLAEPADGPSARKVAEIARESETAILYGYPERADDRVYNAAQLVGADGSRLANMRKAHLFGPEEKRLYAPGDTGLPVVDVAGVKLGILICYDVEFPEAVRAQALLGAELIAVPTALFHPYQFVGLRVVPVRAWENQVYVAYVNRCGAEGDLAYVGGSAVCAPDGSCEARAGEGERLLFAEIDPAAVARGRSENPYLADRRPELYTNLGNFIPRSP